ncbi:ATP-binding protein [Szabonella alba]|uniref:C4-dicarboxylate transport sensor protein DctB n=1 Tax=Szabonella alba TaxID=2804194 RepID=A0A8K0Y1W6_9RHOB|nr:sensor histidine kinase [Szabonella alba]
MRRASDRIRVAVLLLLAGLGIGVAGWLAYGHSKRLFLEDTSRRGDNVLQLAVTTLRGQMARFERLPQLVAEHALIKAMANDPENLGLSGLVNLHLKETQELLGASDIYFMDLKGMTRAASNFDTETSFVGGNFDFRPYFYDAVAGGEGRFYALGTTSRKRGYYFGAPVRVGGSIRGALIVKIDLDAVEEAWRGDDYALMVTDPEGILFLSSRPEWLFTALAPLTDEARARLAANRRYVDAPLDPFPQEGMTEVAGQSLLAVREGPVRRDYLHLAAPMPEADWTIRVLLETASARRQALTVAGAVMLALALGVMGMAVIAQRRARLRERFQLQQAARNHLERRVEERTRELAEVNRRLEGEVAERRLAEQNLRRAQDDLVQAGKMAALGQMSAALSHEFNQPLGAARTFADNALILLDRGRTGDARGNIDRILSLIDRMGSISKHLRSFARSPDQKLKAVSLPEVVEASLEIAQLRLRAAGADLTIALPDGLPQVVAGPVRLQQVLVNILTNAADAVEGGTDRRIRLEADTTDEGVRIRVRDHGPGVPPGLAERIFDPFFSTKGVGKGLGLGLSISYNIVKDFGGNLRVEPATGGGAVFVIDLRAAGAEVADRAA